MDKHQIAAILNETAVMMELIGENTFKIRAYYQGARSLESVSESIQSLIDEDKLKDIKGIGKGLYENILELYNTGTLTIHQELLQKTPPGLFDILRIPGLGPKKIKVLYEKLGIASIGELEYACHENRLIELTGFGPKTQENVLQGIEFIKQQQGLFLWAEAYPMAIGLKGELLKLPGVKDVAIAGSLRRGKEIVKDIDILVMVASNDQNLGKAIEKIAMVREVLSAGDSKITLSLSTGINVDIRVLLEHQFATGLHHFTGSKEHNTALRQLAKTKGMKINEYGIYKADKELVINSEQDLFQVLGLSFIPPELRENKGEIQAAIENKILKLIKVEEIQGDLHVHSNYSDGINTIEELAKSAKEMGLSYIGITDHSKTAVYAKGLSVEKLAEQGEKIDLINSQLTDFTVLKGIEVDILPDGSLDYTDNILAKLDYVVASIHSSFKMPSGEMTKRIIKAIVNPYVKILGHPTGRLLLGRNGYNVDLEQVLKVAREHNVAMELNASPYRLDLDWHHCRLAKDMGVKVVINTDSHRLDTLTNIHYGINIARKGWLESSDILNCKSIEELKEYFGNSQQNQAGI